MSMRRGLRAYVCCWPGLACRLRRLMRALRGQLRDKSSAIKAAVQQRDERIQALQALLESVGLVGLVAGASPAGVQGEGGGGEGEEAAGLLGATAEDGAAISDGLLDGPQALLSAAVGSTDDMSAGEAQRPGR